MSTEEVLQEILKFETLDLSEFVEKYNNFYNSYCYLEDGFASKRVVEKIFFGEAQ